ncbi:hypothetical protein JI735_01350 [Paenibacillus sonchi]|uniref:Uncharacterized protein n=1 Tax=Paenibacillus sonchi TaxID=373687 RepID=A0A974SEJ2_9BACL|nr:hypothetical protein [Paenibacillus sonchi]QQZ61465.1 hypothetical protein JI735_01350 [Paenibacillus sonchi]
MKKIILSLMTVVLFMSLAPNAFAEETSDVTSNEVVLSNEQIQSKLSEFSQKYELNEPFSPEDAAFVKKYATPVNTDLTTFSLPWGEGNHFFGYGLGNYSALRTEGYVKVDIGIVNNTVSVNMNTSDTNQTYHEKVGNSLKFTGFGIVGSDGVGIVADFTLEGENSNANFHKFLDERSFLASVAYYQAVPLGFVKDAQSSQKISVSFN